MAAYAVLVLVHEGDELTLGRVRARRTNVELVDALARLQLAARQLGCSLLLREVSDDLAGLLAVLGMDCLFGEPGGQTERREQVCVEEVVDFDDPVA